LLLSTRDDFKHKLELLFDPVDQAVLGAVWLHHHMFFYSLSLPNPFDLSWSKTLKSYDNQGGYSDEFLDSHLDQGPRRHHVRPAVDITMESTVEHHKSAIIGVILTGMGSDGAQGVTSIKGVGGKIIAEDQSTCVVYGMPRSVVEAGLVDQIVPLPKIASILTKMVNNGNDGI